MNLQVLAAVGLTVSGSAARSAAPPTLVPVRSERARLLIAQQAQAQHNHAEPALIPFRAASFLPLALKFRKSPDVRVPNPAPQLNFDAYTFDYSDGTSATFEALSGDVSALSYPQSVERPNAKPVDDAQTLAIARAFLKRFSLMDARWNKWEVSPPSVHILSIADHFERVRDVRFWEELPGQVRGVNRGTVQIDRKQKQIVYISQRRRPSRSLERPLDRAKCLEAARWAATAGQPTPIQILLPSEMNAEQWKALYGDPKRPIPEEEFRVEEDDWFAQRALRTFDFNTASVTVDAATGAALRVGSPSLVLSDRNATTFKLSEERTLVKPAWLRDALPDDSVTINFNGRELGGARLGYKALLLPPIIRDGQPLICAEYLPAFLIKHTRQGQVLYLRGLLPKEGKTARLTLGSKHARISGQELELEAAPVEVDGRLYVPASLLQRVNGVLVRWEQKPKTLWVDTRYLRRP